MIYLNKRVIKYKKSNSDVPEVLLPLSQFGELIFNNNIISYKPYNKHKISPYLVNITFLFCALIAGSIIEHNARYGVFAYFFILLFISIILFILLKNHYSNSKLIIDLDNECLYSEVNIFGFKLKCNQISKSNIKQISNNIIPSVLCNEMPSGSYYRTDPAMNHLSNQLQNYCISILTTNSKIINIIQLGYNHVNYEYSKKIAKILSDYLNIPLFCCENASKLNIVYNIHEECELTYENIENASEFEKSFVIGFNLLLPIFIGYCIDFFIPLGGPIVLLIAYINFIKL